MALQAVAGSKIYIGTRVALPPDLLVTLADFAAQETEWLEINGWTAAGPVGDSRTEITQPFIGAGRDVTIKGSANAPALENTFAPMPNDPGQQRLRQALADCTNYAIKIEWGAGCVSESVVTVSVANPGVVTWPGGHGLEPGARVMFDAETGTLPTGLSADTAYYVVESGITPTGFSVALTPGGDPIEVTAAGTATEITATAMPGGETDMFYGLVMSRTKNGGEANTARLLGVSIKPNTNIVEV